MTSVFEITHDREFLQHFLTRWRTLDISAEMVERLRAASNEDPYAAYGYGRWLSLTNPGGDSLKLAAGLLAQAAESGVQDANAALAELCYDGRTGTGTADTSLHAYLIDSSYKAGSELAQFLTLQNTIYGDYGFPENPAEVADILKGHIEKHPGCDPIYYDLWGQALEAAGLDGAEKAYQTALEREERESYYSLADLYKRAGDWDRACRVAEEGAKKGAANCRRFKAGMDQEAFVKLPEQEQEALHKEIAEGLDDAITHYDRYACYLKGVLLYTGELGFTPDILASLELLRRGCEMGNSNCDTAMKTILQVDEDDDATGVLAVYPQGFYYAMDVDDEDLDLEELAEMVDARGFDVVHFSPILTRLTKMLGLEGVHIAMLVDKSGYARDLPDNMPATIVYGSGAEIRGTVVFVLEDDEDYTLLPFVGMQQVYLFLQMLTAATGNLVRQPTETELKSIEMKDETPKEFRVKPEELNETIEDCNLCRDTIFVDLSGDDRFAFARTEEIFYDLGIRGLIEKNIERNGGYMIDEWQFVDDRQTPMDIRSRVRFV